MDAALQALLERADRAIEVSRELKLTAVIQYASATKRADGLMLALQHRTLPRKKDAE